MIRRLGLLLLAACDGLQRAERGPQAKRSATKGGVRLYLLAARGASLEGRQAERPAWVRST